MSNPFETGSQFMESVVLDGDPVVFEDVHTSPFASESPPQEEPAMTSKPIGIPIPSSSHSDPPTLPPSSAPASVHYPPTSSTASTPSPSSSYVDPHPPTYSASYPETSSFTPQYVNTTGATTAPEYRRDSGFVPELRETTFAEPQVTPFQLEYIPIEIFVVEPEKHGDGMNAYITYKIRTSTTLKKFRGDTQVIRRYNDFLWFHDQLKLQTRGVLIPPLPEKALINRFSPEFIETRRRELEKFLNRVIQHSILHARPETLLFLEASDEQFNAAKSKSAKSQPAQEAPPPQQSGGFGSFFSAIGHGITAVSGLNTGGTAREIDHWYDAKKNYINTLESQLNTLLKYTSKLLTKRKELAQAHSDFSAAMSTVGSFEADSDKSLSISFIRIAQITDHVKDLCEQLFRNETTHFEEALKDYLRVLTAVKEILGDRDFVLLEYQNSTRALDSKKERAEKEKIKGGPKSKMAEKEVEDAQKKVEDTKREYEEISARVRGELQVFEATRAREIRRMIALLVQSNMENSLQVVDLWKSYIAETQGADASEYKATDKVGWGGAGALR